MKLFRALVVDDEKAIRTQAETLTDPVAGIEIETAASLEDAMEVICKGFFHIAFVDLSLHKNYKDNTDGATVLRHLQDLRPSCRRILLTAYATEHREQVFHLLDPDRPRIHGALDKNDFGRNFLQALSAEAEAWLAAPVEVPERELEQLFKRLQAGDINGSISGPHRIELTRSEVDFVVSSLFGQGSRTEKLEGADLRDVHLTPLAGGKSRAVVLAALPSDGWGAPGIRCVVKIGPRDDVAEERRRYDRYVRFRVSLRRRVEILGHVEGDSLGAVCYSFAGHSPEQVTDVQALLDDGAYPEALQAVEHTIGRAEDWPFEPAPGDDLGGFFHSAYALEPSKVVKDVDRLADKLAGQLGARHEDSSLIFEGGSLQLPSESLLGAGALREPYGVSIVHGDLNARNVIVAADGRTTLIDFRHTSRGPWALDFAALHASIRLSTPVVAGITERVPKEERFEQRLWDYGWEDKDGWWPPQAKKDPPGWTQVAALLMYYAFRNLNGLTRKEYVATCLLYGVRILKTSLSDEERLRLLVWISPLCRILEKD